MGVNFVLKIMIIFSFLLLTQVPGRGNTITSLSSKWVLPLFYTFLSLRTLKVSVCVLSPLQSPGPGLSVKFPDESLKHRSNYKTETLENLHSGD